MSAALFVSAALVVTLADPAWAGAPAVPRAAALAASPAAASPREGVPVLESAELDLVTPAVVLGDVSGTALAEPADPAEGGAGPVVDPDPTTAGPAEPVVLASEVLSVRELQAVAEDQESFDAQRSVVTEQDYFTETFANPDGTTTAVLSTDVINVPSESGEWVRPDNTIEVAADDETTVAANPLEPRFLDRADVPGFLTIGRGTNTINFSLEGAQRSQIVRGDGTVTYPAVFPGVDLDYTMIDSGVQKEFRLAAPLAPGTAEWTFRVSSGALTPRLGPDGSSTVEFVDAEGGVAMSTPTALMYDSSNGPGVPGVEATVGLGLAADGEDWLLTITADEAWLNDPTRVYPVYVDPTITFDGHDAELHNDNDATDGSGYNVVAMSENGRVVYDQGIRMGHCPSTCPNDASDPRRLTTWRSAAHFEYEQFFGYQVTDASLAYANTGSVSSTAGGGGVVHQATSFSYGGVGDTLVEYSAPAGASSFPIGRGGALLSRIQSWVDGRIPGGYLMFRFAEDYGQNTYRTGYAKLFLTVNRPPGVGGPANGAPGDGWTRQPTNPKLTTSAVDPDGDPIERRFRIAGPGVDYTTDWSGAEAYQVPSNVLTNGATYQWWTWVRDSRGAEAAGGPWSFTTQSRAPASDRATWSPGDDAVIATTTPRLSAAGVGATDADGDPITYEFRVATGGDGATGLVIRSGKLATPSWDVPPGSLQDGGAYTWTVLTDDGTESTVPPQPNRLRVDMRLGTKGPSPFDAAGPVSVNLANGNAAMSFGSPTVNTAGGAMGASFSYNSQVSRFGLSASYYVGAYPDTLSPGERLNVGSKVESSDGDCLLTFQADGNLVLYCGAVGTPTADWSAYWSSGTNGVATGGYAQMATDGLLRVHRVDGSVAWESTPPAGRSAVAGSFLRVQTDGNVVVYTTQAQPIWASGSNYFPIGPFMRGGQPVLSRVDPQVSFNWEHGSPGPAVPVDRFTVQWNGFVQSPPNNSAYPDGTPPAGWDGRYRLGVISDDGARMWLDDELRMDRGYAGGATQPFWASTTMGGGERAAIRLDYMETSYTASVELRVQACGSGGVCEQFPVPAAWLTRRAEPLPNGWTTTLALDGGEGEYTSARVQGDAVVLTDQSGSTETWKKTAPAVAGAATTGGAVGYQPPPGDYGTLSVSGDGTMITLLDEDGQTYEFDASGRIRSVTSALDDKKPASTRYQYDSLGRMSYAEDPLTQRRVTATYGGGGACPDQNAPAGMLCRLGYPDGRESVLRYDGFGRLVEISDPGEAGKPEVSSFRYDSSNRLVEVRDSLANDWLRADASRPVTSPVGTELTYTGEGRVAGVTSPAPDGATVDTRAARQYAYVATATPVANGSTEVSIAGLRAPFQRVRTVAYDENLRGLSETDATDVTSSTVWSRSDQVLQVTDGAGRVTTTLYDGLDRAVDTFGPAPAACFQLHPGDRRPNDSAGCPAVTVPRSTTAYRSYDPAGTGQLVTSFWKNTNLAGPPALRRIGLADGANGLDHTWGTSGPFPDDTAKVDGWSARSTGFMELPFAGNVMFRFRSDDGARLWIDDQLVLDTWRDGSAVMDRGEAPFPNAAGPGGAPLRVWHRVRVDYYDAAATATKTTTEAALRLEVKWPGAAEWTPVSSDLLFDGLDTLVTGTTTFEDPSQPAAPTMRTALEYADGGQRSEIHGQALVSVVDPGGLSLATRSRFDDLRRQSVRALPGNNPDVAAQRTSFEFWGEGGNPAALPSAVCGVPAGTSQKGLARYTIGVRNSEGYATISEAVSDVLGRVVGARRGTQAASGDITWEAGEAGEVDPGWACTTFDARGRGTSVKVPGFGGQPSRTVTSVWEVGGDPLTSSVSDLAGTVTSTVDLLGRVTRYVDVNGYTTVPVYDRAGRVVSSSSVTRGSVTPVTSVMSWTYDDAGRVLTVSKDAKVLAEVAYSSAAMGREVTGVSYPGVGSSGAAAAGSGASVGISRDGRGELASLGWVFPGGQPGVTDAVSRSVSGKVLTDTVTDGSTVSASSFSYDGAGRLMGAVVPGHTLSYGFGSSGVVGEPDPCVSVPGSVAGAGVNGNRMRATDLLAGTTEPKVTASCYDGADRLLATVVSGAWPGSTAASSSMSVAAGSLAYDGRGNTTTMGDTTLVYDGADRLVSMTSTGTEATSVTYTRDVTDRLVRRVEVTSGVATTTRYGYSGSGDTADVVLTDGKALIEEVMVLPGGVVCTDRAGTSTDVWAHPNIHGDVIITTNAAGVRQGGVVFYDPYGQPVDPVTNRTGTVSADDAGPDTLTGNLDNGWLGQHQRLFEHAGGLSVIDMGARAYSPVLGRFLEIDPIIGGVDNDYTYVLDPINSYDLDGKAKKPDALSQAERNALDKKKAGAPMTQQEKKLATAAQRKLDKNQKIGSNATRNKNKQRGLPKMRSWWSLPLLPNPCSQGGRPPLWCGTNANWHRSQQA